MDNADRQGCWHRGRAAVRRRVSVSGQRRLRCQEMVELVTLYLDEAMDAGTLARFEQHLQRCHGCAAYLEQFRTTVRTIGAIGELQIDPVFRTRLLDAFADTAGTW
jgi:anti-sigma factor RsiW